MRHLILLFSLVILMAVNAQAKKTLVSEAKSSAKRSVYIKEAEDGLALRKIRRMGVGAQAMGSLGMGGLNMELNLSPAWSFLAGWGGGEGFQAVSFQGKYVFSGNWLLPYASFGYARWNSTSRNPNIGNTRPSVLSERLLSDEEKRQGEYAKDLLFPSVGAQFMQLNGIWAGTSLYLEVTALIDVAHFVAAPTGALGVMYYF